MELTFALAKGRGRYLCPYKLYQLTQNNAQQNLLGFEAPEVLWDSKPKPEELKLLHDIADEFSARRFNGDRDTWPEKIDDAIWLKVTNDRHGCLKPPVPTVRNVRFTWHAMSWKPSMSSLPTTTFCLPTSVWAAA